ncbi:MAG: hypothetical protein OXG24_00130 [Gammaproteobacteria bacterium]|nr:hypothetical protein [Gammaproteobacteria bacterium]
MKITVPLFLSFAIVCTPISADQIVLGQLSHTTVTDDQAGIDFDLNGLDLRYMNFGNDDLYFGVGWASASGDDEFCVPDFCIDFEVDVSATSVEVGYNFDNPFTPFVSVSWTKSETDFGITGMGIGDASDSDTNYGVGTWLGGESRRLQLAFHGVDTDDPGVSLGGYTVLDSSIVLSGFYATTTENPGDSWGVTFGIGWSF